MVGAYENIGLVLTPTEYVDISATPYVQPIDPDLTRIAPTVSERVEIRRRIEHKQSLAIFHEIVHLENALKTQITESVDQLYL